MPGPMADLLRPEDMLFLRLEFVNLQLADGDDDPFDGHPPRLVGGALPDRFIIVHFPPQHIAEQTFSPASVGMPPGFAEPVKAALVGESRLVFAVPDEVLGTGLDFTIANILDWGRLRPVLAPNATEPHLPFSLPPFREPTEQETAVEHPYRLFLSPGSDGIWKHALKLPDLPDQDVEQGEENGQTFRRWRRELWHTRLGIALADGSFCEVGASMLRAIWAAASDPSRGAPAETSLKPEERRAIAHESSHSFLSPAHVPLPRYSPRPLQVDRFMLTAYGALARLHGSWDPPDPAFHLPENLNFVIQWQHIASLGRDQYTRIEERGFLFPFGHRASRTKIIERELTFGGSPLVADGFLTIIEPEKDYSPATPLAVAYAGGSHEMPFRRVRITGEPRGFAIPDNDFVPGSQGKPFLFHVLAHDWEGRPVDFDLPLIFVPDVANPDVAGLQAKYANSGLNHADIGGQSVAFADPGTMPGSTTLTASRISFHAQIANPSVSPPAGLEGLQIGGLKVANLPVGHPPFLPILESARIGIPAVDRMVGSAAGTLETDIALHHGYVGSGGFVNANPHQVFAKASPLPVNVPSDRAGGLAAPSLPIDGLSRKFGAIPMVDQLLPMANGAIDTNHQLSIDPKSLLGESRLLGQIPLAQIIPQITGTLQDLPSLDQIEPRLEDPAFRIKVPVITSVTTPTSVETHLLWKPDVTSSGLFVNRVNGDQATLILRATIITRDGPDPTVVVNGTLRNFALDFLGVLTLTFGELAFKADGGKKLDLRAGGVKLQFDQNGPLAFVNTIREHLPADGFGGGVSITATPQGVTAAYTLAIPQIGIGIISLENLTLSARLILPFDGGPTRFRFALSEREHPFLVTVSLFGGGGFFALEVGTDNFLAVEAAIEFGGNLSLDLGVASGGVYVMAGIWRCSG